VERRTHRRLGKPETFNFLGFTFICGTSSGGQFQIKRKTRRDRMRAKLEEIKEEMRQRRHHSMTHACSALSQKWLKAGVLEDGVVTVSDRGTGQGSVISPLLANVYLHYVFDLWAESSTSGAAR
jgi:hypothetical protein